MDGTVDFNWWDEPPMDGLDAEAFSVRWTGTMTPETSGPHAVGGRALGRFRLFVEDSLMVEFQAGHDPQTHWVYLDLEEGRPYAVRLEFSTTRPNAEVQMTWAPPHQDLATEAVDLARRADAVIMTMGLSPRLEGEEMPVEIPGFSGGDRTSLELPQIQRDLMEAVVATGTPVVLVLLNGSAVGLEWAAGNVPAILETWYPGQAGGTALAQVLFGDRSPGGRLPVTFYRSVDQLPPFDDYDMSGRTYRYFGGDPLFPFGFGLSYTTFEYGKLELPREVGTGEEFQVAVEVRNTGDHDGDEVVQLYVTDLEASRPQPIRTLQGFQRIHLEPGEATRAVFNLGPSQLGLVTKDGTTVVEPGRFRISVGGKQPGFRGTADAPTPQVVEGLVVVRN